MSESTLSVFGEKLVRSETMLTDWGVHVLALGGAAALLLAGWLS